jgi:iron complex transport system ATP-binding protein
MSHLHVHHLAVDLGHTTIIHDLSFAIAHGEFVGVVGPNGSGKSTLLRALHRALKPVSGSILCDAHDIWRLSATEVAQRIAVVAQENPIGFEFSASEVAAMGRIPYKRGFENETDHDHALVAQSLADLGLTALAHRSFDAMSGGERQRTLIARALVQQAPILLLDEPTNHLDIHYQIDVLHRVHSLKLTTFAALHDLNLAATWCQRIIVMDQGNIVAQGPPAEALRADIIERVFRIKATPFVHPISGRHQLLFDRLNEES